MFTSILRTNTTIHTGPTTTNLLMYGDLEQEFPTRREKHEIPLDFNRQELNHFMGNKISLFYCGDKMDTQTCQLIYDTNFQNNIEVFRFSVTFPNMFVSDNYIITISRTS